MKIINKEYVEKIVKMYNNGEQIPRRQQIFYKGIEHTLNSNVQYVMNNEELREYTKCANDIIYFIEIHLGIKLRKYQKDWILLYKENRFTIYNVARQTGFNTIFAAINLHDMIFNNKNILYIQTKYSSNYFDMIKSYYMKLQYFLKPGIIIMNAKLIKFNNAKISVIKKNIDDYDIYEYNNFAFMKDKEIEEIYKKIIPNIAASKERKIIITSTPNGKNYFYNLYKNSSITKDQNPNKNCYKSIQTYWWEVEGRDLKWKEEEIKRLGSEDAFNREHDLEF